MSGGRRPGGEAPVHSDLAEAALDSGFALLRLAESQFAAGGPQEARRSLREAESACAECGRRLFGGEDAVLQRAHLEMLRSAIHAAKVELSNKRSGPRACAKVIQMPAPKTRAAH